MRPPAPLLMLALIVAGCSSPRDDGIAWIAQVDGDAHAVDGALSLALAPDGERVYVGGLVENAADDKDLLVFAVDVDGGGRTWTRTLDGAGGNDEARLVAVSPDGSRVLATGPSVAENGLHDFLTVALDAANGEVVWSARFDGPDAGGDSPHGLAVTGDLVLVAGTSRGEQGGISTVAYDLGSGDVAWTAVDAVGAELRDLVVTPDGEVIAVGQGATGSVLLAYDASSGEERWRLGIEGPGALTTVVDAVAGPDGSTVFVAGTLTDESGKEPAVIRVDEGRLVWSGLAGQNATDSPQSIAISPDGRAVAIVGEGPGEGGRAQGVTVLLDAENGGLVWATRHADGDAQSQGRDVAFTPDGARVLSALLRVQPSSDHVDLSARPVLAAYDAADGAPQWHREVAALGFILALVVTPDGALALGVGSLWTTEARTDAAVVAFQIPA